MSEVKLTKRQLKKQMNIEIETAVKELDRELGLYEYFYEMSPEERMQNAHKFDLDNLYPIRQRIWKERDWSYAPRLGFYYRSRRAEFL